MWKPFLFLYVLEGDEPAQFSGFIDNRKLLNLVTLKNNFSLFERGSNRRGDEVLRGHDVRDLQLSIRLKAQIAVCENTHQLFIPHDWNARDTELRHQVENIADSFICCQGDRVKNHSAFRPLHLVDFFCLFRDGHIFVDDADTSFASECDSHLGFRYRIHSRREDRDIQLDCVGQAGRYVDIARQYR